MSTQRLVAFLVTSTHLSLSEDVAVDARDTAARATGSCTAAAAARTRCSRSRRRASCCLLHVRDVRVSKVTVRAEEVEKIVSIGNGGKFAARSSVRCTSSTPTCS
jgi:hypothetical protein